jgi:dolichyl-phosphate beta-glucosyltransferase
MTDLSIVIPAYNEAERLPPTLDALHRFLAAGDRTWEIVVVDDGSTDDTAGLVERLAATVPHLRLIRSTPNRGKGSAVRIGMLAAGGAIRVMYDADGSMPPGELPRLVERIRPEEVDVAIGSRYVDGAAVAPQPLYRRLWSRLCNRVVQRTLVPGVRDTQCGFKAFTAAAAQDLFARARVDGWAFDLEILALARHRCYGLAEVGVAWHDDRRSKINPLRDLWKVIREAVTIRRNLRRGVYRQLATT